MAASATLALKAGVWLRRGRRDMGSPDSRATACPPSGRNSTYRPVQISGAGSVARPMLRWTWAAFVLAVITGSLLFMSQAVDYFATTTFRVKLIIIALAGINMLIFEGITARGVRNWDDNPTPPLPARLAGGISLLCWLLVFA